MPAYVLGINSMIAQEMDMSSGAAALADAAKKKQMPSGDSLDQIQQARNTPIRLMSRNIEGFISEVGMLFIPCLLQFYTAERRTDLLGTTGLDTGGLRCQPRNTGAAWDGTGKLRAQVQVPHRARQPALDAAA